MTLQIRVDGPSVSRVVSLTAGGKPLIAGRDANVDIPLADPERLLSRKHLVLRPASDSVELTVISSSGSATLSSGELLPGQSSVLQAGDRITVGPYTLTIEHGPEQEPPLQGERAAMLVGSPASPIAVGPADLQVGSPRGIHDTLRAIDGSAARDGPDPGAASEAVKNFIGGGVKEPRPREPIVLRLDNCDREPLDSVSEPESVSSDYTPPPVKARGGDSGTEESVFELIKQSLRQEHGGAGGPLLSSLDTARKLDIDAFASGLGVPIPENIGPDDWKRIGSTLRHMVEGFGRLMSARAALKGQLGFDERTELYPKDNNPFKAYTSVDAVLRQLLFNANSSGAYVTAERAVRESAQDLMTHDLAIIAASRACAEGAVKEFDPQRLLSVLEAGQPKSWLELLRGARLWRSYCAHYGRQRLHMADWIERLYNEHFLSAYTREAERLRQEHVPLP